MYYILNRSWQTVFLTENNHHKPSLPPIPPALKLFQDICHSSKSSFLIILCMVFALKRFLYFILSFWLNLSVHKCPNTQLANHRHGKTSHLNCQRLETETIYFGFLSWVCNIYQVCWCLHRPLCWDFNHLRSLDFNWWSQNWLSAFFKTFPLQGIIFDSPSCGNLHR